MAEVSPSPWEAPGTIGMCRGILRLTAVCRDAHVRGRRTLGLGSLVTGGLWGFGCGAVWWLVNPDSDKHLFEIADYWVSRSKVMVVYRLAVRIQTTTSTRWVVSSGSHGEVFNHPYTVSGCMRALLRFTGMVHSSWGCGWDSSRW